MHRYVAYLLVLVSLFAGGLASARAEKRVALVIGNTAYESVPQLRNPMHDAEAISAELKDLGFDIVTGLDLKHRDFAKILGAFKRKLEHANVALFFYAGHALQVKGRNYLAPVDALLDDETSLSFEAVELGAILGLMERRRRTNLIFLDACRDNPLARNLARSMGTRSSAVGRGLARVESGVGTLIAFATQPGNVALDGEQKHSPFTQGLIKHIGTPGLDVALMMRRVRQDVIDLTGGRQIPWEHSSLTASFMFRNKPKEDPKPVASTRAVPSMQGMDSLAVELAFWQAAKDAGTRQAYEAYLRKYPEGNFSPLVVIKLEEFLQAEAKEAMQQAELGSAKKKRAEAEKAKSIAEAKQRSINDAARKKQASAEAAKRKSEADSRQLEVVALENKQAEERERLAKEREELDRRLKTLEELAKARAEAKKKKEQQLAALQPPEQQPKNNAPATALLDPYEMTLVLQNELKRVGCEPGKVDGAWGKQSNRALARFNVYAKLNLPTDAPTIDALETVKGMSERVCPLNCGAQYRIQGDECVQKTCGPGKRLNVRGQCVTVSVKKPKTPSKTKKKGPSSDSPFYKSPYEDCVAKFGEGACEPLRNEG